MAICEFLRQIESAFFFSVDSSSISICDIQSCMLQYSFPRHFCTVAIYYWMVIFVMGSESRDVLQVNSALLLVLFA